MGTTMSCCEVQRTTHKDATRSWTRSCCEVPGTMLCCDTHETSDAGVPCSLQVKNRGESSTTTGRGMNSGRELPTTGRINTGLAMQDAAALNYRKAADEKLNRISRFESRDKGAATSTSPKAHRGRSSASPEAHRSRTSASPEAGKRNAAGAPPAAGTRTSASPCRHHLHHSQSSDHKSRGHVAAWEHAPRQVDVVHHAARPHIQREVGTPGWNLLS